jgi:hypothetical protein
MISDSGIRTNHEMFNDSTQAINGWGDYPTHRKIIAYKPAVSDAVFGDDPNAYYHGTHTSGTDRGRPEPVLGRALDGNGQGRAALLRGRGQERRRRLHAR